MPRSLNTFTRLSDGEARSAHGWLSELSFDAPADRPYLFMNMVSSADGRAAVQGRTNTLGSDADTELLGELRTIADAVLIGSGTLRAEGYARLVSRPERVAARRDAGRSETPLAVLLSRSLDLPWDAGLFRAADQPIVIYSDSTEAAIPATAAPVRLAHGADPRAALTDLRARGVKALLCEGGPTLFGALLAAGLIDELFWTIAPRLTGEPGAPRIVEGRAGAADLRLQWVLCNGDELFLRYRLS